MGIIIGALYIYLAIMAVWIGGCFLVQVAIFICESIGETYDELKKLFLRIYRHSAVQR